MNKVMLWDFHGTLIDDPVGWSGTLTYLINALAPELGMTRDRLAVGLRRAYPWDADDLVHPHLTDAEAWWAQVLSAMQAGAITAGTPEDVAATAIARFRPEILDHTRLTVFPDTRPALELAREHGWRNVIVSNHVPELADIVRCVGLSDLAERVVTSAAIGYEKPHAGFFRAALESVGKVDQAWMVGDNPLADIAGARQAGLPAILVRRRCDHPVTYCDGVLEAFQHVLKQTE